MRDSNPPVLIRAGILHDFQTAGPAATPALMELLKHSDRDVRLRAAEVLGLLEPIPRAAIPSLVDGLADRDWEVRQHVARVLGRMASAASSATEALEARLDIEDDEEVREALTVALEAIATSEATGGLQQGSSTAESPEKTHE
jgi:HEAT repeat protein